MWHIDPSQQDLPGDYNGSKCIVRSIEINGREIDVVIPLALTEQIF